MAGQLKRAQAWFLVSPWWLTATSNVLLLWPPGANAVHRHTCGQNTFKTKPVWCPIPALPRLQALAVDTPLTTLHSGYLAFLSLSCLISSLAMSGRSSRSAAVAVFLT